ncbi:MAG: hypothetical protein ACYDAD_07955 [Acidimicrobiales bacterium]
MSSTVIVRPWVDPTLGEDLGHDPRGSYAEAFWLPRLGPTSWLLLRRFAAALSISDRYMADADVIGPAVGVSAAMAKRAMERIVKFGLGRRVGPVDGVPVLEVRQWLPPLTDPQLQHLHSYIQIRHEIWLSGAGSSMVSTATTAAAES